MGWGREQIGAADLARQAQQIQSVAKESQNETRRLASAIDTLNSDRDRLYTRVTVLEQGLDSVTGAIARQSAVASVQAAAASTTTTDAQPPTQNTPPAPSPAPSVSPVATTATAPAEKPRTDATAAQPGPATAAPVGQTAQNPPAATPAPPLVASKSIMAPPDAAASKLIEPEKPVNGVVRAPLPEVAASPPADETGSDASESASAKVAVQRTEFGVDVGGAHSLGGMRALRPGFGSIG